MGEGKVRRALLGALLVLGLLGMHELVGVGQPAAHAAHEAVSHNVEAHELPAGPHAIALPGSGGHGTGHGFGHLCVFVLATLLGMLLAVLGFRVGLRFVRAAGPGRPSRAGPPPRPPPCAGRTLLHLVCVLRT